MCLTNYISPQFMVWAWKETSLRYIWLCFVGRQLSATHSKHASMQMAWHCQPSTPFWTIFAGLLSNCMYVSSMDVWRDLGTMCTDSFHVPSSHLIHSYSIGLMVSNHVLCISSSSQEIEATLQLTRYKSSSLSWFSICPILLFLSNVFYDCNSYFCS